MEQEAKNLSPVEMGEESRILTYSGVLLDVFNPDPNLVNAIDFIHGLAMECRWGNQCPHFYSVAQHSVLASDMVPPEFALTALLHDTAEAYMHDMPRPIKSQLPKYKEAEKNLLELIVKKYGGIWPLPPEVKEVDDLLLNIEWNSLMISDIPDYSQLGGSPWEPREAEEIFQNRWIELTGGLL